MIAKGPMGHAVKSLTKNGLSNDSQRCVSFTETPLEHAYLLLEEISGRAFNFRPYGIAIPKKLGRVGGVNPVWYVDITPGHDWLSKSINDLIGKGIESGQFDTTEIALLAPLIEQMGCSELHDYRKEFWWEREWRHIGDFNLPVRVLVLCPEAEVSDIQQKLKSNEGSWVRAKYIDPYWSLEQIIARLAGFSSPQIDVI